MNAFEGMRVLHLLAHYPGREGTSAYGTGLATAMSCRWPGSCPVLSYRADGREAPPGVEVLRYPQTAGGRFRLPDGLLDDLQSNRHGLDGMVLHGTYNPPVAALARRLRRWGIPYIFMPHDPYVPELRQHHRVRKTLYWHLLEKRMIEGARAVQLLDETHEKPLRELGCRVPVFVTPNGCDPALLELLNGNERRPGSEVETRILYLGRLDRNHKGLDLLLNGFAQWARGAGGAAEGVKLILTGNDWTDRAGLERLAERLGIAGQVEFTGARKEASIRIHAEADLVVLPSRFDGFGLTIMEAMLAARPVLVSTQAGVSSHVARAGGGFLTKPAAADIAVALAGAIGRKAEWTRMGLLNQAYVMSHLTWDQVAEQTMAAYCEVFGK